MAIGKASDFKIYQEQFHTGVTEVLRQNAEVFNGASAGTILFSTMLHKGDYVQEAFWQELTNLISRRDTTSVAAATDQAMTQAEDVKVKLNRKIGPVAQTIDAFKKISADPEIMSFILGKQWGVAIMVEALNTALGAAVAAYGQDLIAGTGTTGNTGVIGTSPTAADTMTHSALVNGLAEFGDRSNMVSAFVMHPKVYHDLMKQSIADKIVDVAGVTINAGSVATLGKPVIVTQSSSLVSAATGGAGQDEYLTLCLTPGAIQIEESEGRTIVSDLVTGLENLVMRYQGEYAYSLSLKGYAWDITNGGANPTSATVNTATNWDQIVTDDRSLGGSRILSS